ncbi:hypothetical protein DV737_g4948, partial [Chaetothyriales sp. CBS 132003]
MDTADTIGTIEGTDKIKKQRHNDTLPLLPVVAMIGRRRRKRVRDHVALLAVTWTWLKATCLTYKLTLDLSPSRLFCIPADLQAALVAHGFGEVLGFFPTLVTQYLDSVLDTLSAAIDADLGKIHKTRNMNVRLCDYSPDTASSTIFQDGNSGLEIEDPAHPDTWIPVSANDFVVLCGWRAHIISGGQLRAVRHRVRGQPGTRRLSAVLFIAPNLDVTLKPLVAGKHAVQFSPNILNGEINVEWFKEIMWRSSCVVGGALRVATLDGSVRSSSGNVVARRSSFAANILDALRRREHQNTTPATSNARQVTKTPKMVYRAVLLNPLREIVARGSFSVNTRSVTSVSPGTVGVVAVSDAGSNTVMPVIVDRANPLVDDDVGVAAVFVGTTFVPVNVKLNGEQPTKAGAVSFTLSHSC